MLLDPPLRHAFDQVLEDVLDALPNAVTRYFEEIPLVVEDHPSPEVMREMQLNSPDDLCGLHDGVPLTAGMRGDTFELPDQITIYRQGILSMACDAHGRIDPQELRRQIHITVLHELGHHFGLDEDQLEALGYG